MIELIIISCLVVLLFVLQRYVYTKNWYKNLYINISFSEDGITEGSQGSIKEIIENRKRLPLSMLKVKFDTDRHLIFDDDKGSRTTDQYYRNDIFQINAGEKITRVINFLAGRRGYYTIDGVDIVGTDLLMSTEMSSSIDLKTSIYVYPRPFNSNEFLYALKQLNGEVLTKRHLIEDPFEYRGIREYQPYDDMKSINWKATARTDDWKVNQKNYTSLRSIRILINLEDTGVLKKEACVEACMQICVSLAECFLKEGFQLAIYCNGHNIIDDQATILESSGGMGQMHNILKALALVDTSKKVSPAIFFKDILASSTKDSLTIAISPNMYEDFIDILSDHRSKGNELYWFYVTEDKQEPEVPEELETCLHVIHLKK